MQQKRSPERDEGLVSTTETLSAIARTMLILEALEAETTGLGVSELARRTGLSKSSVHRMASELTSLRVLERHGSVYRLGLRLFELGQKAPRHRDLREAARPYMSDLREATGHSVHLAVLDGTAVVYLEVLRSPTAPPLPTRSGVRWPAHGTGIGKAILAYSGDETVERIVANGLPRLSERTIDTPGRFHAELTRIRERGVSYDLEESRPGVVCAASPVFGHDGTVVAGLSVSGWHNRINLDQTASAVRTAALGLSRQLGSGH
ncbi:IclR family transcriptional regulator [Gordonia westfalica]|uniref:IclR family transcriptional regulator n=1 Tax=Gordonia westfalica TaxID=158898 RepID=A0ABU2H0X3_9ACTN|nr:IclR family transcriptional regulator [Gordonia westfalica]MDS1117027.1 IclR family transcriptional regulator [Gordonia westfalica]